jgi:hypothetical protein
MSRLLLKARPTPPQITDRLRAPLPDGLELYLDTADLLDTAAMDSAVENVEAHSLPADFVLLIEGPVRSLDGDFFDLSREAEADREVILRLGQLARRLSARAVNIHAIAPTSSPANLDLASRQACLERGLDLVRFFVDEISTSGAIPTIENMPPVLRMRQGGFFYSPIGMASEDLVWLCERAPGLRCTLDLSHAGLYVNCQRYARGIASLHEDQGGCPELFDLARQFSLVDDVQAYAASLGPELLTCHVSNATGLLGEGEPYDCGELALDGLISELASVVSYFVTETLEADPDHAVEMRRALEAMRRVLQVTPCR